MKKILFSGIAICIIGLLLSFTPAQDELLHLSLTQNDIVMTEDGDILEDPISTQIITPDGQKLAITIEFCPGRGNPCSVIFIGGDGNPVVLAAKKCQGCQDVIVHP